MTDINQPYRKVATIHAAPHPHWVGNGFFVNAMFSHMVADKRTDPFLMLDYASPKNFLPNTANPKGVGQHPHKGFETVTIAYQGEVAHRDSSGGGGTIKTGDVQWMTAGKGVMHDEFHSPNFSQTGGSFEMVQLWVNLPAKDKLTPAKYQHLSNDDIPVMTLTNETGNQIGKIRLIAGEFQDKERSIQGLGSTFTPINLWDLSIDANKQMTLSIPQTHNLLLLVRHGQVRINDNDMQVATAKQLVSFEPESGQGGQDRLRLQADKEGAEVLLMSGEPINEPVVGYGPFVMNSEQEIIQAMQEFREGKFGKMAD